MELKLKPFDFAQAVARAGLSPDGTPLLDRAALRSNPPKVEGGNFQLAINAALKSVSATQLEAQGLQRELQMGNPTVSLEQTMIASQKAQIGFQAALTVRNRLVNAYTEIMSMQV